MKKASADCSRGTLSDWPGKPSRPSARPSSPCATKTPSTTKSSAASSTTSTSPKLASSDTDRNVPFGPSFPSCTWERTTRSLQEAKLPHTIPTVPKYNLGTRRQLSLRAVAAPLCRGVLVRWNTATQRRGYSAQKTKEPTRRIWLPGVRLRFPRPIISCPCARCSAKSRARRARSG